VFVVLGHQTGTHAPGDQLGNAEVLRVTHHVLLAHGKAVQAIRAASRLECQVGAALNNSPAVPATESAADIEAARRAMFDGPEHNFWSSAWWGDPMVLGQYPASILEAFAGQIPILPDDMATIKQPLDFMGMNIYSGKIYQAGTNGQPEQVPFATGFPTTLIGWPVLPEVLRWGPRFFSERYGLPIYITENGLSNEDWIARDGHVHDPQRIEYTTRYLLSLHDAIKDGVDMRGYFHWSIMDNFEWAEGYKQRFGLVHVDYTTQKRTPKDSAYWYRDVIRSNGELLF
jgi:beta-glucosidase